MFEISLFIIYFILLYDFVFFKYHTFLILKKEFNNNTLLIRKKYTISVFLFIKSM